MSGVLHMWVEGEMFVNLETLPGLEKHANIMSLLRKKERGSVPNIICPTWLYTTGRFPDFIHAAKGVDQTIQRRQLFHILPGNPAHDPAPVGRG